MPIQIGNIRLYSLKELSENLGVTKVTLRSYLRKGKIAGRKMGTNWYVTEESLREFFNAERRIIRIRTKQVPRQSNKFLP
jgi:excisionase family DNA binding protein